MAPNPLPVCCLFLLIQLLCTGLISSQQLQDQGSQNNTTCSESQPLGFTALSPQQLRQEIRGAIVSSVAGELQQFSERLFRNEQLLSSYVAQLDEVLGELNSSLLDTQVQLVHLLQVVMDESSAGDKLEGVVRNLTSVVNTALLSLPSTTAVPPPLLPPLPTSLGRSPSSPALSCQQIFDVYPQSASGHYYVSSLIPPAPGSSGSVIPRVSRVYCSMGKEVCGGKGEGGWMRMAHINMTDPTHACPPGDTFIEWDRDTPPKRLCIPKSNSTGCFSHKFPVLSLARNTSKICGRVIAYQNATPNGFYPFHTNINSGIDSVYIDGISLTHGLSSRTHIWTFVAALDETPGHLSACACSNRNQLASSRIPAFVGHRYFCDTGSRRDAEFRFYPDDPLWDGKGCGSFSSCCSLNNPPWFSTDLGDFAPGDSVEMRVCRDSSNTNENIPFELVELYVN